MPRRKGLRNRQVQTAAAKAVEPLFCAEALERRVLFSIAPTISASGPVVAGTAYNFTLDSTGTSSVASWSLTFGDGTSESVTATSDPMTVSHTYSSAGQYAPTAQAHLTGGGTATAVPLTLDSSFGAGLSGQQPGTVVTNITTGLDAIYGVTMQGSDILTAGVSGGNSLELARYLPSGALDSSSFGTGGKVDASFASATYALAVTVAPDGTIFAGGTSGGNFALAHFSANGTLDTSFGSSGLVTTDFGASDDTATAIAIQPTDTSGHYDVVLAGYTGGSCEYYYAMSRYSSVGVLDTSFNGTGEETLGLAPGTDHDWARALQIQPDPSNPTVLSDDRYILGGYSLDNSCGPYPQYFALTRLSYGGCMDDGFGSCCGWELTNVGDLGDGCCGSGPSIDSNYSLLIQADGSLIAAGASTLSGIEDFAVGRFDSDGNLDSSFGDSGLVTTGFSGNAVGYAAALQTVGSNTDIVVAGSTSGGIGGTDIAVARYVSIESGCSSGTGGLDSTFGSGGITTLDIAGGNDYARAVLVDPNTNDIVVAGGSGPSSNQEFGLAAFLPDNRVHVTLPAPVPLTLTPASTSQINLGWTDPTGTSSSVVQKSTDGVTWTTIATPSGTTATYNATGLSAGVLYYFRVAVVDSSGDVSPWATGSSYTYYHVQGTGTALFAYQNASASFTVGNIQAEGPSVSSSQISAQIDWGDDTQSAGTITASGNSFTLTGSHDYYREGAYAVTAEVIYSPPSASKVATFLGSYMEVRKSVDEKKLETADSYGISGSAAAPLTPTVLTINSSTGSYSLSVIGSATYSFSQTLDQADQDSSDSVLRQETGGSVSFGFSDSGTFALPLGSPSFSVASYSLSSGGSASLTMIDDQRAVNDSLDQTLAAEDHYSHTKTYTGSTAGYTWNYDENANLGVSGGGKLYEDRFGLGAADGIAREDAQLEAFLDANAGLVGSYTLSGTQSYDDAVAETGNYSSQTWNGTDVTTRGNTLAETGSNQSLSFSQGLDGSAEDSVTITGTDNSYSLTDAAYSDPAIVNRTVTDLSSTTTGTGQIDVGVTLNKHGDTSTGAYTLTATDGSGDSTLTLTTTNQGQVTGSMPTLVEDYSDTNTGNVESGDYSLTSTMALTASTDQTLTDSSLNSSDVGSTPYGATLTQTGDLYGTEYLSLTESTVSGYNTTDTTDQAVTTDVSESPTGDYTLSATVDQSGGTFTASTTLHTYDDADTTQDASSQTMTAHSPSSLTETLSGGGNVLTGAYSGITDNVTSGFTDTSTLTNQSLSVTDTVGSTDTSSGTDSGNDYNGSYTDTSTDAATSTDHSTTANQSLSVTADSSATDHSTATNSGDDDTGVNNTTSTASDTATASTTTTDQGSQVIDHNSLTDYPNENDAGNDFSGSYTDLSTDNATSTDHSTTTNQSLNVTANSTSTNFATDTNTGDDDTGASGVTDTATNFDHADSTTTNQSLSVTDSHSFTDYPYVSDSGNDFNGSYTDHSTDTSTSTDHSTTTNQSLHVTASDTATDSSTSTDTGNSDTGADSVTSTGTDYDYADTTTTNQSLSVTDHHSVTDYPYVSDSGNDFSGTYTDYSTDTATSTDHSTTTNQSLNVTASSTATDYSTNTDTGDDDTGADTVTSTGSDFAQSSSTTTNQSLHVTATSTASDYSTGTNTANEDTGADTVTDTGTDFSTSTSTTTDQSLHVTATYSLSDYPNDYDTGNDFNGTYADHSTDTSTATDHSSTTLQSRTINADSTDTDYSTSTDTGNDDTGADSVTATGSDIDHSNSTTTLQSLTTTDHHTATDYPNDNDSGNDDTGSYTNIDRVTVTSTDHSSSTDVSHSLGDTTTVSDTSTSTHTGNDTYTSTDTGNDDTGLDDTTSTGTDTGNDTSTTTDQSQTITDISSSTGHPSETDNGNDYTGTFTDTTTDAPVTTDHVTTTDQSQTNYDNSTITDHPNYTTTLDDATGLDDTTGSDYDSGTDATTDINASESLTDTTSPSDHSTTTNNGNDDTGAYTLTTTTTESGGDTLSGSAGTRDYTGSDTMTDVATTIDVANDDTDASTTTVYDNPSTTTTTTDTYSGGSGGYDTQTVTDTAHTTNIDFEDPGAGTYSLGNTGTDNTTTTETNYTTATVTGSDTASYTLTGTSYSDFSSSESGDDNTGDYSLTTSSTDGYTYTRTDSASGLDVIQSDNDSGTVTTTGNDIAGDYTATAIGNDTVVTTQDARTSTHTDSSTLTNTGNDYTGEFNTTGTETLGTTIDESSTYSVSGSDTPGTYAFHEGSSDSPNISITGNNIDGTQTSTQIGDESYSVSDGYSSDPARPFAFDENGDKSYTLISSEDANTGDTTSTETGTDNYTLSEGGPGHLGDDVIAYPEYPLSYTLSVTGSEDYGITITSNSQSGDFSQTYTGGGDYTAAGETTWTNGLTESTFTVPYSNSGSTSYDDTESGDTRDGGVTLTESGTDRYRAVPSADYNPGNEETTSSWRGDYEYSPVGLPYQVTRASVPAGIFSTIGDDRYDYCFAAGTLVLMADGSRKPIEKIEEGEMVLAAPDTDPEAEPRPCRVLEVYHNPPAKLLAVNVAAEGDVSGGAAILVTAEHPFYVKGHGWTKAAALHVGQRLHTPEGAWARVASVGGAGRTEPVFNLRVQSAHTYFAGATSGDLVVLVHNDSSYAWTTDPDNANSHIGTVANRHEGVIVYNNPDASQPIQTYKFHDDQQKDIILTALRNGDKKQELHNFIVGVRETADSVSDVNPIVGARTVLTGKHASDTPASPGDRALVAVGLLAGPAMKAAGSLGEGERSRIGRPSPLPRTPIGRPFKASARLPPMRRRGPVARCRRAVSGQQRLSSRMRENARSRRFASGSGSLRRGRAARASGGLGTPATTGSSAFAIRSPRAATPWSWLTFAGLL